MLGYMMAAALAFTASPSTAGVALRTLASPTPRTAPPLALPASAVSTIGVGAKRLNNRQMDPWEAQFWRVHHSKGPVVNIPDLAIPAFPSTLLTQLALNYSCVRVAMLVLQLLLKSPRLPALLAPPLIGLGGWLLYSSCKGGGRAWAQAVTEAAGLTLDGGVAVSAGEHPEVEQHVPAKWAVAGYRGVWGMVALAVW